MPWGHGVAPRCAASAHVSTRTIARLQERFASLTLLATVGGGDATDGGPPTRVGARSAASRGAASSHGGKQARGEKGGAAAGRKPSLKGRRADADTDEADVEMQTSGVAATPAPSGASGGSGGLQSRAATALPQVRACVVGDVVVAALSRLWLISIVRGVWP
jgi:hypothetical protein